MKGQFKMKFARDKLICDVQWLLAFVPKLYRRGSNFFRETGFKLLFHYNYDEHTMKTTQYVRYFYKI